MVTIKIPGAFTLNIKHVLLDFNGTIAVDGRLVQGVGHKINDLAQNLDFHVITADTFGSVKKEIKGLKCSLKVIPEQDQVQAKRDYLETLGKDKTIAAGNGANDESMLREAVLGIAVLGQEGLASKTLAASDIMVMNILDLFGYLEHPGRLVACLRR
ncbi:MAG: ATPase P [Desulfobacterium sp.]